jgi:hypothetical protein
VRERECKEEHEEPALDALHACEQLECACWAPSEYAADISSDSSLMRFEFPFFRCDPPRQKKTVRKKKLKIGFFGRERKKKERGERTCCASLATPPEPSPADSMLDECGEECDSL